ncbi:hypothetical protein NMG60_11007604 [Bertholletia excelsa]
MISLQAWDMAIPAISISSSISVSTSITATSDPKFHKQKPLSSTLKALSKSGKLDEALRLIESLPSKSATTQQDLDAYASLLHACISRKSLEHGQRLYLQLLLSGDTHNLLKDPTMKSKFITLYSLCGRLDEARRVFEDRLEAEHLPESVWVAMAIGYSRNGYSKEALLIYCDMLCGAIHAQIIKSNEEPDQVVYNALLRLYSECGCFEEVLQVFDEMPQQNIVSWNLLIAGFVQRNQLFEALDTFRRMQEEGVGFSWVTFTTLLPVCGRVTALYSGKEMHAQIVKSPRKPDVLVQNSLVDMYAKCGAVDYSRRIFDAMQTKDVTSWNAVLTGCAVNGLMKEAMELFDEMLASGFWPDGITFIALLSGCSHAGLTDEGRTLFDRMNRDFRIAPTLEHYACLVDLLSRGGRIKEALEVVKNMPMKPSGSIWGSLLNSCRIYGDVSVAEAVAKRLFELEPNNPGNYVLLSNTYANVGLWERVKMVRMMMEMRGIKKDPGCSWIQIKNRLHTFVAGGGFELRSSDEYRKLWNKLSEAMKAAGYLPDTKAVLHDINEQMKAMWICGHSEKLATMFGLIHTGSGPIRIAKNLRVCVDCHSWMKIVSRVTGRMIILRDTNRFHHFDKGMCSCRDYW